MNNLDRSQKNVSQKMVLTLFGTRPEVIKLAPVIKEIEARNAQLKTLNITSGQHTELLYPFVRLFGIRIDHDLRVMEPRQTLNQICARVLSSLDPILEREKPDFILVQGDTTTAVAGALAGFYARIPVGHVEAGLGSGNSQSPFPEEMNRRLISELASYHFAATPMNGQTLVAEGVSPERIFVTGNPVVDSLKEILAESAISPAVAGLLDATRGLKRIVLTTHRRESFGQVMAENLIALKCFVEAHEDVCLLFPVHPNPEVVKSASSILSGHRRIHLVEPLDYTPSYVCCLRDGLLSPIPVAFRRKLTLGKPLLVLRENTERPEALKSGVARLVGGRPKRLAAMLEDAYSDYGWGTRVRDVQNPFGAGDSGKRIARIIEDKLTNQDRHPLVPGFVGDPADEPGSLDSTDSARASSGSVHAPAGKRRRAQHIQSSGIEGARADS
jgi:UDP-N-acetylglucosamine 2-epimerase (non-hydrolysing)